MWQSDEAKFQQACSNLIQPMHETGDASRPLARGVSGAPRKYLMGSGFADLLVRSWRVISGAETNTGHVCGIATVAVGQTVTQGEVLTGSPQLNQVSQHDTAVAAQPAAASQVLSNDTAQPAGSVSV